VQLCGIGTLSETTSPAFCREDAPSSISRLQKVSKNGATVYRVGFLILIDENLGTVGEAGSNAQRINQRISTNKRSSLYIPAHAQDPPYAEYLSNLESITQFADVIMGRFKVRE
jgi:hypothetical protein